MHALEIVEKNKAIWKKQGLLFYLTIVITSLIVSAWVFFAFHRITTNPGQNTVLVDRPFFGGAGGVRDEVQLPGVGWYWFSTEGWNYDIVPFKVDEPLDHLPTADNNFINYQSYIVLQWTDVAYNVKNFGSEAWYLHNIKEPYRTIVRDVTKNYNMTAIMTDSSTLATIEKQIREQTEALIKATGVKVRLVNLAMGKALPNQPVVTEMDVTAINQQRIKSEGQRKRAEDGRREAETSRAAADNAYRQAMGLDPSQFVQLEAIKRYSEACAKSACTIIQGSTVPIVVGK